MDFPHFLRALWRAALGLDAPLSDIATTSHTEKSCYNYEEASSPKAEDSHEGDDELSADLRHGSLPPRSSLTVAEWAVLEPFYRAHAPHDEPQTWRHLRSQGHTPVERESLDLGCCALEPSDEPTTQTRNRMTNYRITNTPLLQQSEVLRKKRWKTRHVMRNLTSAQLKMVSHSLPKR